MTVLPLLRDLEDATFNPFVSEVEAHGDHLDPYPQLAKWREQGAVHPGEYRVAMGMARDKTAPDVPSYMIFGYEACSQALGDSETFSNKAYMHNLGICFGRSVSTMDGEEHAKYRRIFQKVFLPQHVKEWGASVVQPVVDDLLEEFIHTGKADLINQFTLLYPFNVIYRQLDLPPDQGKLFQKLAVTQTLVTIVPEIGMDATAKLGEFFPELIRQRRENPGDDLVSRLVQAEVDGEYLPEDVLVSFFRQLVNAGGDTTYRGTSVFLTMLLKNPDQLEMLRNDRSLLPNAIEEALRYDGPVNSPARWVTKDIDFFGTHIPKDSIVYVMTGSANRDPAMFEDPDKFDILRPNANRHLAFTVGKHICIGQHLARIEMTRAINAILDRLPNLRLDPEKPEPQLHGIGMRVPYELDVVFDPS